MMKQQQTATVALLLLAGMGCLIEGAPMSRGHHIVQFRKLNALVSSDASTSQSFGDVIFESSASAPEGEAGEGAAPEPSTEEVVKLPAVSPEESLEETPETAPDAAPEIAPDGAPEDAPEAAPEDAPEAAPEDAPEAAPEEAPAESPQDIPAVAPAEPPAESPEDGPAEVPSPIFLPPEEAPVEAPDIIDTLEKDMPDLFPASAPDDGLTLEELSREQLLNTSRNFNDTELDIQNTASRKSGAALGTSIAFILAWAVLP